MNTDLNKNKKIVKYLFKKKKENNRYHVLYQDDIVVEQDMLKDNLIGNKIVYLKYNI